MFGRQKWLYAGSVVVDDGDAGCVDAAAVVVDGVGVGCVVVDAGFDVGLVVVVDGTKTWILNRCAMILVVRRNQED